MSKKSFIAGALFGAAVGVSEIIKDSVRETSSDRIYIIPQQPQQQYPQYQQGGRPVQRGTYRNSVPLYKVHRETLDVLDGIRDVCDDASHSIGRELAYQIHRGYESGYKDHYDCSRLARREFAEMARLAGVYNVRPHDGDAAYRRLYWGITRFINTNCEIVY